MRLPLIRAPGSSEPCFRYGIMLMKVREVIRLIEDKVGTSYVQGGDHRQYKHPAKQGRITISGHPGHDMPPGTLSIELKQAGLKGR